MILSDPVQVKSYVPKKRTLNLGAMETENETIPRIIPKPAQTESLGSKASQSFSVNEGMTGGDGSLPEVNYSGEYDPGALDKVQNTLSGVSNAGGIISGIAPELAGVAGPIGGVAGLANSAISGGRAIGNMVNGTGSFLDNAANLLGVAASFAPQLAIPATAVGLLNTGVKSYQGGILGDGLDARERERERDTLERFGYSRAETNEMNRNQNRDELMGEITSSSGYSLSPNMSSNDPLGMAASGAFDPDGGTSLGSRAAGMFGGFEGGGRDSSDHNVGGERGSSTGTGGGYNDGNGGVSGL